MFRNPGYPATYSEAGDCEWKITKSQENICQIRLDFETMEIADPNGKKGQQENILAIFINFSRRYWPDWKV